MEEKHNNATQRRPEGARPLDAGIIPIHIPKYIEQIKNEEAYHKNGKNAITVFKSDKVTITLIALKKEESFQPGKEENEATMSLQVIKGLIYFESFDHKIDLQEGELVTLHQQLSFKTVALNDTICLLTMVK
ncbi:hypothetical protein FA048_07760 [Pedobacter polaris]|uniref:Quercetin 2,3-dioxygenase C-terminal cupin domain-containing protein n=1 Tax=Pedobacter polaris TaxID=2571273 RepID=A0A4U1CSS7_9SPHI|nr:hypothetical protein [Pedobacter polaris]TKC10095.1 hypothetical protein FA048_07760 [Pedobacter polaris]